MQTSPISFVAARRQFKGGTKWFSPLPFGIPGLALTSDRNYKAVVKSYNRTLGRCLLYARFVIFRIALLNV